MKKAIVISTLFFLILGISFAQKTPNDTLKVQTSGQCSMCKERIEKALAYEKGVKNAEYDEQTAVVTVIYKPKKTNPKKIRLAITKLGHDADDQKGDVKAYSKLPECCKKPEDRHKHGSNCTHE